MSKLDEIHREKQLSRTPNFPTNYLPSRNKGKSETNSLTQGVMDYIALKGGFAMRINSQGQYDERLGAYRKSGSTKGVSDIMACYKGQSIGIEIKVGKDKLNENQIKFKENFTKAGGIYFECRNIDSFVEFFDKLISNEEKRKL